MGNYNYACLVGNLTADAELHYTNSGSSVVNFNIAVNSKVGENDEVLFMPCVAFGKLADVVVKYTSKGKNVMVAGRLRLEKWTNSEGENRSQIKLYVNSLQLLGSPIKSTDTTDEDF